MRQKSNPTTTLGGKTGTVATHASQITPVEGSLQAFNQSVAAEQPRVATKPTGLRQKTPQPVTESVNTEALKLVLNMAVTDYDRSQEGKPGYNRYALAQYLAAVDTLTEHVQRGTSVEDAIQETFNSPLASKLSKAIQKHRQKVFTQEQTPGVAREPLKLRKEALAHDPGTIAPWVSPKQLFLEILKDPRFEADPLREEIRVAVVKTGEAQGLQTYADNDPSYQPLMTRAMEHPLIKGTPRETEFRLVRDSWSIPNGETREAILVKSLALPYARSFNDLFVNAAPHPTNNVDSGMYIRNQEGRSANLFVAITPKMREALQSRGMGGSLGPIHFEGIVWDAQNTLIVANYTQILGDRWLAVIDTASLPAFTKRTQP